MSGLNVPVATELASQFDSQYDDDELQIFGACIAKPELSARFKKFEPVRLEATKAASFLPKVALINVPAIPPA